MKNNNSKIQHDAYIKSLEKIRKSLMPLSKSFAEMAFDMSALTGVTKIISSQIEDLQKNYGVSSLSEAKLSLSMAAYNSLDLSDSYKKTLKYYNEIGRQFSTLNFKDEYRKSLEGFQNLAKSMRSVNTIDTTLSIQNFQKSMKSFTHGLMSEQISQLKSIDYSKIFYETLEVNGSFKDAVDAAYATLQDEQSSLKKEELETDFASEQEIQDTINDQINNPVGFQERIANWAEEKYKKYFIVINLWLLLWGIFVQPYLQENVGRPVMTFVVSNVKELPQKGAKIVAQLRQNIEATIVENTNYYYKVTFTDENGIQREGYVAKRNLKIVEQPEAEDEIEKESSSEE